jgi:hypothetical protein
VTYKTSAAPDVTQALTATSCALNTSPTLLNFKAFVNGNPSTVGLRNGSIGVKDGTSTATACGRVSTTSTATESLQIDVNVGRPAGAYKPVATSAFLDLEVKGNAKIQATTSLNGVQNGVYELQAGTSIGSAPTLMSSVSSDDTHVANPNCGAVIDPLDDDGYKDNCRFAISVPSWLGPDDGKVFDSITLKALQGSFSLEGGADGVVLPLPPTAFPQKGSIFELAGGVLDCSAKTDIIQGNPSTSTPSVYVAQLGTLANGSPCTQGVPFTLTNGPSSITFLKNLSQQPLAQFVVNPTWNVPIVLGVPASTSTKVTFPTGGDQTVNPCPGPTYTAGALTGISDPLNPLKDMDGITPGIQYACYATSSQTVISDPAGDYLQVVEQIYLEGDVKFTR